MEEPGELQSLGSHKSRTQLSDYHFHFHSRNQHNRVNQLYLNKKKVCKTTVKTLLTFESLYVPTIASYTFFCNACYYFTIHYARP